MNTLSIQIVFSVIFLIALSTGVQANPAPCAIRCNTDAGFELTWVEGNCTCSLRSTLSSEQATSSSSSSEDPSTSSEEPSTSSEDPSTSSEESSTSSEDPSSSSEDPSTSSEDPSTSSEDPSSDASDPYWCPFGTYYDGTECFCDFRWDCPEHHIWDKYCYCRREKAPPCNLTCNDYQFLHEYKCKCLDPTSEQASSFPSGGASDCPYWMHYDGRECACGYLRDCTKNYIWDEQYCYCRLEKPPCNLTCNDYQILDEYKCKCLDPTSEQASSSSSVCDFECTGATILDPITCTCIPTNCAIDYCAPGYVANFSKCSCDPCPDLCPENVPYEIGSCSCCNNSCPDDQLLDQYCECQPRLCDKVCPPGYELDVNGCSCWGCDCICALTAADCPAGTTFLYDSCQCAPNVDPECPEKFFYDNSSCVCICEEVLECPNALLWNEKTCECVCPLGEICPPRKYFDAGVCGCVCENVRICDDGFEFNDNTCACACIQPIDCLEGDIWDELTCQCVPSTSPFCPSGFTYDPDLCDCICSTTSECLAPKVFFPSTCSCQCQPAGCQFGFQNPDTCQCDPIIDPIPIIA